MTDMTAKVAAVLSEYSIALNVGSSHGVQPGDKVTLWRIVDVTDPDSNEPLGTVRLRKLDLDVTDVQERLSVARVQGTLNFGSLTMTIRRKISSGRPSDNSIYVKVGEEATIHLLGDANDAGVET